jgi:hypothetical protein
MAAWLISRRSHTLANFQSRFTVSRDTPIYFSWRDDRSDVTELTER